jgi:hypothetical protein
VNRLFILLTVVLALIAAGCGGKEKESEIARQEEPKDPTETDFKYPQANPTFKIQGALLDSLRVKKQRFGITRDEYWRERGGVLANQYFEVWYPRGEASVTHGMYVFEELMPARAEFEAYFGSAPGELLKINIATEIDVYQRLTGREWWYYADMKGDSLTFVPVYTLYKRGISDMAVPHEYYQWAIRKLTLHGAPRWLEEGMASHLSKEGDLLLEQMYEFFREDHSMSPEKIEEVLQSEDNKRDARIAYFRSYRMVKRLMEEYGEENLKKAIVLIGLGRTLDQAFSDALGIDYSAVLAAASDYTVDLTQKKGP